MMKHLYNILLNICSIFFVIIVTVSIAQVFFRFILDSPLVWSEELARFLMLWMVFLGASVVSYRQAHLGVDFLFDYLPPKINIFLKAISTTVTLVFLIVLVITSMELLRVAGYATSPALNIPLSYWRVSVVAGSSLMILALVVNVIAEFIKRRKVEG